MKYILTFLCALALNGASAQFSFQNINLLSNFDDPTVPAEPVYGIRYQSCWGWADPLTDREYGIIGSSEGTYIIEVTDPGNPVQRDYIPGRSNQRIWHEYKTVGNYLYIISDGGGNSLQIVDLTTLPDSGHVVYDGTNIFDSGHTLYVDGTHLYVASVSQTGGSYSSMNVYDVSSPATPVLLRRLDQDYPSISQVHDMFVINDTIFASCGYQGLYIFTYDESTNRFTQRGSLTNYTPGGSYNHSSFISNDRTTLYMMDEVPDGLPCKVVDVSDLSNPFVVDTFYSNAGCTPHNPYVKGNLLVNANYQDGVWIYDISNPQVPVFAGYFDTHPQNSPGTYPNPPYAGCWAAYTDLPSGTLLASDMQLGLFCLDIGTITGLSTRPSLNPVRLFPNPAQDRLTIALSESSNGGTYLLTDLQGRELMNGELNAATTMLDISRLNPGFYLVKIQLGEQVRSTRIQITR